MKSFKLYLLFLIIFSPIIFYNSYLFSQSSWFLTTTDEDIPALDFVNLYTGYAAGGNGVILKTTNSGDSWTINYNNVSSQYLWNINFIDEMTGWAAGKSGTIIKTTNGAVSWNLQNSNTSRNLLDVEFTDSQIGWATGDDGIIIKTVNGGNNWSVIQNTGITENIFDVEFINANTGWIAGDGGLYKSTNGGQTWQISLAEAWVYSAEFINENTGWAGVRFGKIFKTTNGGGSWNLQSYEFGATFFSIKFVNENSGWAAGDYNILIHTTNGGLNWFRQSTGVTDNYAVHRKIDSYDAEGMFCWVSGYNSLLLKTQNSGTNWEAKFTGVNSGGTVWSEDFINDNTGWIAASYGVITKTINGGYAWHKQNSGTTNNLINVNFVNENTGWAVGHFGTIIKTVNSGVNWFPQSSGTDRNLFKSFFLNTSTGWVVGDTGILKTTNGGLNWFFQSRESWVYSIYFVNGNTGWAGVRFGKMMHTTDGGSSWTYQQSNSGGTFFDMKFMNENTGWAAGDYNSIIRTTNGGVNWIPVNSGLSSGSVFRSIFIQENNMGSIWICGYSGIMIKSENLGQSWHRVEVPVNAYFNSIMFSSPAVGYATGGNGIVIKTTNGGMTFSENENSNVPGSFILYQNYPNPFNPITTIDFKIFEAGFVSLTVYDLLGRQAETLVNKNLSPGDHSVTWNASGHSSGIYFYRINFSKNKSGSEVDTEVRKMLLIK